MRKLLVILGIPIDDLTMPEALDRISEFIETGRSTGKVHQVATINADFIVKARHDPELRYLLQESDMATADGMPLVWGARLLGVPLEGRVTGADMVPALAGHAAKRGYTMYFLGAAPGVAARAAEILTERHPDLKIVGTVSPPYAPIMEMDRDILAEIKAIKPDILLVAFGNPKQEKWIGMYGRELGVPVMIGVGGTFDFIAGKTKRAPEWMQRTGLEWLYRLLQEPRRLWRRYVVDMFGFSTFFIRQWWLMRRGDVPAPLLPTEDAVIMDNTAILKIKGRLDLTNAAEFQQKAHEAMAITPDVMVNLNEAIFLDSTAIGTLVALTKQARDAGGELWLVGVPDNIQQTFSLMRLDRFFVIRDDVDSGFAAQADRRTDLAERMEPAGQWTVVKVPHRLDATTVDEFVDTHLATLKHNAHMVLDFSETAFLASAGLAAMAQLNRVAQADGGEVRVASCSPDVQRVIELVRFDKVMPVFADVATATS